MTPAFEKRIRRHVVGREHDFFAITTPGLEDLCHGELGALGVKARAVSGGVESSGRLNELYRANLNLRTASRVLMRVQAFRATSFRALENEVSVFVSLFFVARWLIHRYEYGDAIGAPTLMIGLICVVLGSVLLLWMALLTRHQIVYHQTKSAD